MLGLWIHRRSTLARGGAPQRAAPTIQFQHYLSTVMSGSPQTNRIKATKHCRKQVVSFYVFTWLRVPIGAGSPALHGQSLHFCACWAGHVACCWAGEDPTLRYIPWETLMPCSHRDGVLTSPACDSPSACELICYFAGHVDKNDAIADDSYLVAAQMLIQHEWNLSRDRLRSVEASRIHHINSGRLL